MNKSSTYRTRALILFLRLNAQRHAPLSMRGRRAARLKQRLAMRVAFAGQVSA